MGQYTKTLEDYLYLLKRRKYYIIVTWLCVSLLSILVAYSLPKSYRSTATLLFEAPLQTKLVESSMSQFADEQIQSIYQRVMTTENVLSIIDQFALYDMYEPGQTKHELADFFRESAEVSLTASTFTPKASSGMAEIAFNVSFVDSDPLKSQQVASKLAALFIAQNEKTRKDRAVKASDFLMGESEKLSRELQEIESKIANYKEENNFILPEQIKGNMESIDRIEGELRDTDSQIRTTKERIMFLGAELARSQDELPPKADDKAPLSKDDALRSLRAKYAELSSIYSPSHPSLTRLKREIKTLDPGFEGSTTDDDALKKLHEAELELKTLEESYSNKHPDIAKLKSQIDKLHKQLNSSQDHRQISPRGESKRTTSPAYLAVEAQYRSSQSELQALYQKHDYLIQKLDKLRNMIMMSPQIEKGYNDLVRSRDNTMKKYTQLKEKWLDAKLLQTQEEQQINQSLTIIEPAEIPMHPEKAIRRKVAIGGILFGLIAGFGLALILDFLDPRLTGYRAIAEVTGLVPIVLIPYIETPTEEMNLARSRQRQKKILIWGAWLGFALIMASLYYHFYGSQ